jgi:ribonucrease Y
MTEHASFIVAFASFLIGLAVARALLAGSSEREKNAALDLLAARHAAKVAEAEARAKSATNAKQEADVEVAEARTAANIERKAAADARRDADDARRTIETVKKEAAFEAKEAILRATEAAKAEAGQRADALEKAALAREDRAFQHEQLVLQKEDFFAARERELAKRDATLRSEEVHASDLKTEAVTLVREKRARLEAVAGMSGEEARRSLMEDLYEEARRASAREAKAIEDTARDEAEKRAKRIIGLAVQRYAGDHVQERAVTSIHLTNDDLKGRIIGREGRNIRALQEACGVDFIVDDTPETIVISGFDPMRREIARMAIERLIADGRIHPSRIEEVVLKAQEEVARLAADAAEQACIELGVTRVHPELMKLLGRLKYRYSYAQNVLKHSVECGFLCGLMAVELGQNEKLARRAGLLHDIGKAVSHEQEGGHAVIGGQYARKFGEDPIVANGVACHHDDEPATSIIGHLVTASDSLSGARPGARREMLESYVKRLHDLEALSLRFAGVERTFAIQAGREIRVLVEPSEVTDAEAALLAREISKRIEEELSYPGQIRVTVIRETRAIDYAK